MLLSVAIIVIAFFVTWWRPGVGLALAAQGYLLRSALSPSATPVPGLAPGASYEAGDPVIGIGLPMVVFLIIAIKSINTWQHYRIYAIDALLLALGLVLILGARHAPDFESGIEIVLRYFALGASFYFFGRLALTGDARKAEKNLTAFLGTTWAIAILLGVLALFVGSGLSLSRLTVGNAHPIVFSLLIGTALIINLYWIARYKSSLLSVPLMLALYAGAAFLSFVFVANNTRGTVISLMISLLLIAPQAVPKQPSFKSFARLGAILVAIGGGVLTLLILQPTLANRLLENLSLVTAANKGQSIDDRLLGQGVALRMFGENPFWGVGTGGFSHYSFLDYPHNMILEIAAEQGIMGLLILGLLLGAVVMCVFSVIRVWRGDFTSLLIVALVVFNLVEAQFSFALWMHKNLFLALAFLVALHTLASATSAGGLRKPVVPKSVLLEPNRIGR